MDHDIALVGLLYLPVAILGFLILADLLERSHVRLAHRFLEAYRSSSSTLRAAALLMLMAAAIHASLVFTHFGDERLLALQFAGYALALGVLSLGVFVFRQAAWPALALLLMGVFVYAGYVLSGQETVDPIGLASKAVEIAAVVALLIQNRSALVAIGDSGTQLRLAKQIGNLTRR